ncbi:MAG: FHA domain-containing protein [Chloroflexota bacterium]|nr:FHA domain-containing protein [Chloroflexota bacterium]
MGPITFPHIAWPADWGPRQLALLAAGLAALLLLLVVVMLRSRRRKKSQQRAASSVVALNDLWLQVRSGPGVGAQYPLYRATTLLGSAPEAQVSIPHPQVEAHHASLSRREEGFILQDMGSSAGTFVNGHRITEAVWVRPGDVISLGEVVELVLQA